MRGTLGLLTLLVCALGSGASHAQAYPSRPVKIVVPFAAGSGSDAYARLIAEATLIPIGVESWPVEISYSLDAEISSLDALMTRKFRLRCSTRRV